MAGAARVGSVTAGVRRAGAAGALVLPLVSQPAWRLKVLPIPIPADTTLVDIRGVFLLAGMPFRRDIMERQPIMVVSRLIPGGIEAGV